MKRLCLSTALLLALCGSAMAEPPVCADLRARLANLPEVIGNGPDIRRYSAAIAQQTRELRKVEQDMRRQTCDDSVVTVEGGSAGYCGELEQSRAQMLDSLRYLKDQRDQVQAEGSADGRARRRLQAALDDSGCGEGGVDGSVEADIETVTAAPRASERQRPTTSFIPINPALSGGEAGSPSGGYVLPRQSLISDVTTICVRSCDGGFFPLHSNVTSVDFQREAQTCAEMCPGIKTELFYQPPGNADQSRMISVATGAPYRSLPNAYAYRNRRPGEKSECACDISGYFERMRQKTATGAPGQKGSVSDIKTIPAPSPDTAAKPLAATPEPEKPPAQPQAERDYDPAKDKVRQVGPQFLPAEQGAINPKEPDGSGLPQRQP